MVRGTAPQQSTKWSRLVEVHGRLLLSVAIGVAAFPLLTLMQWRLPTRLLVAWDIGIIVYLLQVIFLVISFDLKKERRRAAIDDEGGSAILVLVVLATIASLVAIVAELGPVKDSQDGHRIFALCLAVLTITLSWIFIQTIFAFHYAYEFYGEGRHGAGGLTFPNDNQPDYWDFIYFSFVIGMTFQVSDVQVTSKLIRRIVLAQGFVSFIFNVAIVALMVNIGASVI